MFSRTAFSSSSRVSAKKYSGDASTSPLSGWSWNCPPYGAMIRPALMIVGPSTRPLLTARRRLVQANSPSFPTSRTVVNPVSSMLRALATPWIAR